MNTKTLAPLMGLLLLAMAMVPNAAAVQAKDCDGNAYTGDGSDADACAKTGLAADKFVKGMKQIAGPLMGVVLLGSGIALGVSGGNERVKTSAKAGLIAGVIGLSLVFLADPIVEFIIGAFA